MFVSLFPLGQRGMVSPIGRMHRHRRIPAVPQSSLHIQCVHIRSSTSAVDATGLAGSHGLRPRHPRRDHQRPLVHGPGWSRWTLEDALRGRGRVLYTRGICQFGSRGMSSLHAPSPLFRHSSDLRISVLRLGTQCHGSQWYVPSVSRDIGPVMHSSDDLHNHSGNEYGRHPPIPPISDPQPVSADTLPGLASRLSLPV